ncbi:related to MMS21-SUMO ligase and component of the SMC5-SMC6 complex [Ustilago bromivora]|uniref:Related to MMS21-SUMO ligase and component of the SMC5-SMC6 complex n=1 Tax=Ustilago bromivora TaxID=307758 RepID=A0A1K0GGP5_9BASI|nr:related to MMS21-SUMO ligase and component of the SMC5-SMC6 complex [Ustilago bromivora]
MPSSTRRRRVDDSEEEQDVAPPSQRRTQASTSASASAGPSRSQRNAPTSSITNGIDLTAELRPQPLGKEHISNINGLMVDLKAQDSSIAKCIELLSETAEQAAEAFRHQDECPELEQADADLRELIDAQAEKAIRKSVLMEIVQDLQAGVGDPAKRYKDEVQKKLDAYNKQTSRKKYAKNTDYHNFKNVVWVAREEGAMPPVRDLIPAEEGDDQGSDDDLEIGGVSQNFRCPLTTNLLEDPLTNTNCTHSYSRSAIMEYVAAGNNRCPASSCTATVTQRTLKQDPALSRKVAAFKRREEERIIARRQISTVLY